MRSVDVLGVNVSETSLDHAVDLISKWIESRDSQYVCVTGVHGVMESQFDEELRRIHNAAGLVVPDGAPVLWAGRIAGLSAMKRVRGPDLLPAIMEQANSHQWRCFFYGGAEGVAGKLAFHNCLSLSVLPAQLESAPSRFLQEG